jgi:hypothetical protein
LLKETCLCADNKQVSIGGSKVHDERERTMTRSSSQRADVGVAPTGAIHNDTVGCLEKFSFRKWRSKRSIDLLSFTARLNLLVVYFFGLSFIYF